jgi:peptidoglycan hydrolase-like protein with peptidoglycan-binding domain
VPDKRIRSTAKVRSQEPGEFVSTDGLIGRIVDGACDNPAMSAGLLVMALTATAIASNAMFLQNARHPEPLFSTRPALVIERHERTSPTIIPIPPRREDQTGSIAPLPRARAPITDMIAVKSAEATLIHEIQTILGESGLYRGSIDGVYGALSRSAISAYQEAEGLLVTGEPSAKLLDHMQMKVAAVESPSILPPPIAIEAPPTLPPPPSLELPPTLPPPGAMQIPVSLPVTRAAEVIVNNGERLRYERVQTALNLIGYGPVSVGGVPNEETSNAIRRFELDNGLQISGAASVNVIDRLIAIGALPPA